ncbi:flagellar filament capping protein FliD [Halarcobacter sp.]|uniref:flagellar filament capping protein FliD n=1 Tax=Halarcobacter sp. TaxID=2321133 RepID=UPI0029F4C578|nr:flagellar filament capping protein FliD [Halarcobacter sp.]
MADGILGLGSSGSVDLSQDLLDKLKEAESKAYITPIENNQEDLQATMDAVDEVTTKLDEFLSIMEEFDLYTTGTNAFNQVSATTTGTAATFNAADTSNINPGSIAVTITELAQKDVYQSIEIADKTAIMPSGSLGITIGGETTTYETNGKTYEELVTELNYNAGLEASLEQVGDNSYRLILKSSNTGLENSISISQSGLDLGYEEPESHTVSARNMEATIDGINYNLSSNKLTLDNGLMIAAVEKGDASISIERDDSYVIEQINNMATSYNELVQLVDSYTIGDEDNPAVISDSSTLRSVMNDIKSMFYGSYGLSDEENAFSYGITFNEDGLMEIDNSELSEAVTNNYDDLKELFVGYAEKEGLGTRLSNYLDDLDSLDGIMTSYEDRLSQRLEDLNDDLESETERLDTKYAQMAQQFAQYTVIITEMENSFNSLKMIMDMETSDS